MTAILEVIHNTFQEPHSPTKQDLIDTCLALRAFCKNTSEVKASLSVEEEDGTHIIFDAYSDVRNYMEEWYSCHTFSYDTNYRVIRQSFVDPLLEIMYYQGTMCEQTFDCIIDGIEMYAASDFNLEKTSQKLRLAHLLNQTNILATS